MVEQCLHSKKNRQESSGIVALDFFEQTGHAMRASMRTLNVVVLFNPVAEWEGVGTPKCF